MNTDKEKRIEQNSLSAHELLRNRGINNTVWKEWEESLRTLPKTGTKQFEPNGSLLQNLQIENGLKNRKRLLGIEKVERCSNLAVAEWLPVQKKARVVKKSGQDWSMFGHEINCTLFLFPEEALLLLEMNCLELIWNNTALSVQQAYEILLDESTCSLEEYRVYSQLTRCGYRIQRFVYKESEKNMRTDEPHKRKVIIDPINGLRMDTNLPHAIRSNNNGTKNSSETEITTTDEMIGQEVQCVIKDILLNLENKEENVNNQSNSKCNLNTSEIQTVDGGRGSCNKKTKNSKVEIISSEMLVRGIKIVKDATVDNSNTTIPVTKWHGTRISRNVKVLPKRTDKPTYQTSLKSPNISIVESSCGGNDNKCTSKRKSDSPENIGTKKSKQEIIELSDEEIEEVPRSMTRMEMLNLLPDIARKAVIREKISRQYIPRNIKPQKSVYQYERSKLLNTQGKDKGLSSNTSANKSTLHSERHSEQNQLVPFHNQNLHTNIHNPNVYGVGRRNFLDFNSFLYNNRLPLSFHQNIYWHNRLYQQNIFQNILNYVAIQNFHSTFQHNRCLSIQVDNFSNTSIIQRNCSTQNRFQQDVYQNVSLQHRFYQGRESVNTHNNRGTNRDQSAHASRQHSNRKPMVDKECFSKSSFTKYPGISSWKELKKRWCEEKTITIDDDDSAEKSSIDCNEVEIVQQCVNPLIGPKNAESLAAVYDRLQIIKSAPEKMIRKKRSSYKISYNVYSSSQHYKKSNPGEPLCRIVVIRQTESLFIQPIELSRLQQDSTGVPIILAYVSMSISYIQPGVVSVPDFIEHR